MPGGQTAYALPELESDRLDPFEQLRRVLGEWVADVSSSANLVILRTPPGCAHVVASALDRSALDGLLGTVAGDDTLLCVAASDTTGEQLAGRLRSLAGLGGGDARGNRPRSGTGASPAGLPRSCWRSP